MFSFFKSKKIDISVLVPVFGTENTLLRCLESVKKQDGQGFTLELVVVDDCSVGNDESGHSCMQIVREFKKTCGFAVQYIRHDQNKGAFEARRTAVYASKGERLFMLDSDDCLEEGALLKLLARARESGAHIIHADARVIGNGDEHFMKEMQEKAHNVHIGMLCGRQIIEHFLFDMDIVGFMCIKLFDRELILNALEHIPSVSCTMAEDYLLFFWGAYEAALHGYTYLGVKDVAYVYYVTSGITSRRVITDIKDWVKVVSTASVFTSIFSEIDNLSEEEAGRVFDKKILDCIKQNCRSFLAHNILSYRQLVSPEIKAQAYELLCEYWGKDFVEDIEKALEEVNAKPKA